MKILIQQLARLGDIYMTWPFVRALKRQYLHAEVHMLVRGKFEAATIGLEQLDKVVVLKTPEILEPIVNERGDIDASLARLEIFLDELSAEGYSQCYNLSYSPLSSYINHFLSDIGCETFGFTRHSDGFFNPNDEVSSYFYAQVGPGKANRVHLIDIFASYLQTPLIESDYMAPVIETRKKLPKKYFVVHVGASEGHKKLNAQNWGKITKYILDAKAELDVVLVGAPHERGIAEEIETYVGSARVSNFVGDTRVEELFPIIKRAELLIGCDSAPIHIATLTDTPTLNISLGQVNFWETGPKATNGFIFRMTPEMVLTPQKAGVVAVEILSGNVPDDLIRRTPGLVSYVDPQDTAQSRFAWQMAQAIYLGGEFPIMENYEVYQYLQDMMNVNAMILENIQALSPESSADRTRLIERGDQILQHISQKCFDLSPLVRWVEAEKVRIPPAAIESLKKQTYTIHHSLQQVFTRYMPQEEVKGYHGQI